jgi:hypothetical protein
LQSLVNPVLRAAEYDGEVWETRVRRDDGGGRYGAILLFVRMCIPVDQWWLWVYLSNHACPPQYGTDLDDGPFTHLGCLYDGIGLNHHVLA